MRWLLDLALPVRCPVCRRSPGAPCPGCAPLVPGPPPLPPPAGLRACVTATAYEGAGRDLVAALKFRGAASVAAWAAGVVADPLAAVAAPGAVDVVTWIPTAPAHRRHRRGVDGGQLLAGALAAELGVSARPLLHRRRGPAQAGRDRRARLAGPPLVLRRSVTGVGGAVAGGPCSPAVPPVVVVADDVVTTGGSLAAAARLLRAGGAVTVLGAAVARTP